jgi:hypothetical protein
VTTYPIVGMQYRGSADFVSKLERGSPLLLVREANNSYDLNAIQVWTERFGSVGPRHIGYVKGTLAPDVAIRLDAPSWASTYEGRSCVPARLNFTSDRWPTAEVEWPNPNIKPGREL